jgi:hypothetical protein
MRTASTSDLQIKIEKLNGLLDHYFQLKETATRVKDWAKVDDLYKKIGTTEATKVTVLKELNKRKTNE